MKKFKTTKIFFNIQVSDLNKNNTNSPGWCGSVGQSILTEAGRPQVQFQVRTHTQVAG